MQLVMVRGADGGRRELALVRRERGTTYVCPVARYEASRDGNDDWVVGFPAEDVSVLGEDKFDRGA